MTTNYDTINDGAASKAGAFIRSAASPEAIMAGVVSKLDVNNTVAFDPAAAPVVSNKFDI